MKLGKDTATKTMQKNKKPTVYSEFNAHVLLPSRIMNPPAMEPYSFGKP
jgi:hypothetical protein